MDLIRLYLPTVIGRYRERVGSEMRFYHRAVYKAGVDLQTVSYAKYAIHLQTELTVAMLVIQVRIQVLVLPTI